MLSLHRRFVQSEGAVEHSVNNEGESRVLVRPARSTAGSSLLPSVACRNDRDWGSPLDAALKRRSSTVDLGGAAEAAPFQSLRTRT